MRTIYQYVRPKLPRMGLIFSIKTFGTIIELFLPWLLSSIIDDCAAVGDVRGAWLRGGLMLLCALAALFGGFALLWPETVIGIFLPRGASFGYALQYLAIVAPGFFITAIDNVYATCMKSSGQTVVPMVAGIC